MLLNLNNVNSDLLEYFLIDILLSYIHVSILFVICNTAVILKPKVVNKVNMYY